MKNLINILLAILLMPITACQSKDDKYSNIIDGPLVTNDVFYLNGGKLKSVHEMSFTVPAGQEFLELTVVSVSGIISVSDTETYQKADAKILPYGIIWEESWEHSNDEIPDGQFLSSEITDESVLYDIVEYYGQPRQRYIQTVQISRQDVPTAKLRLNSTSGLCRSNYADITVHFE